MGTILSPQVFTLIDKVYNEKADSFGSPPSSHGLSPTGTRLPGRNSSLSEDQVASRTNRPTLPEMVRPLVLRNEKGSSVVPSSTASSWDGILSNDDDRNNAQIWEWMVHSVMVTTDPPPKTIAIVVEDDDYDDEAGGAPTTILTENLLSQALMYRSVQSVFVIVVATAKGGSKEEDQKCTTNWTDSPVAVEYVVLQDGSTTLPFQRGDLDVAIVLPRLEVITQGNGVDDDGRDDSADNLGGPLSSKFWFDHLSSNGVFSTVVGRTFPLDHPASVQGQATRMDRVNELVKAGFTRIIDYDIPLVTPTSARARAPINVGVAFKADYGISRWRMNEAHYRLRLRQRLINNQPLTFDSAIMTNLRYPPKHSALGYCSSVENTDDDDCDDVHGYDPEIPCVPLSDLFVSRSKAGENAGRGVFTNVDIPAESYISLETSVYPIYMDWTAETLHNKMLDHFEDKIPRLNGTIISVYAEAYGYTDEPWGVKQTTVMSHFLTFTNHGCNSTSNLGVAIPGMNEFTIDPDAPIPEELRTSISDPYNPVFDRDHEKQLTSVSSSKDIAKGDELYDDYMSFGGDEAFKENILTLRRECSGVPGMVERYQSSDRKTDLSEVFDVKLHS